MSFCVAETVSGSSGGRPGDRLRFRAATISFAGALGDQPSLEVRDSAEGMEHEFAGGRGGVEALLATDQVECITSRGLITTGARRRPGSGDPGLGETPDSPEISQYAGSVSGCSWGSMRS